MSDLVRDPQVEDLLNFISTVWTEIQQDIDSNEIVISERQFGLQHEAHLTLLSYGIDPELHYLKFLVNDRPGKFVIFDEEDKIVAEFDSAEACVNAFHEDTDGFHRVYFIPDDEREYYEFAD